MVEGFSSDLLRAIISYWAGSHLESSQKFCQTSTVELFCETRWLFPQKSSAADVRLDSKCVSDWRYCKCEVQVDCECMEFVPQAGVQGSSWRSGFTFKLDLNAQVIYIYLASNIYLKFFLCTTTLSKWHNVYMKLLVY